MHQYLTKGAKVLFTGELAPPTTYQTKDGVTKIKSTLSRIHSIVLLSGKKQE